MEIVNLFDLDFTGYLSCFTCKRVDLEDHCYIRNGLFPVLDRIRAADANRVRGPVYFSDIAASFVACMERFYFSYTIYSMEVQTFCPRLIPTEFIYTMNANGGYIESQRPIYERFDVFVK